MEGIISEDTPIPGMISITENDLKTARKASGQSLTASSGPSRKSSSQSNQLPNTPPQSKREIPNHVTPITEVTGVLLYPNKSPS